MGVAGGLGSTRDVQNVSASVAPFFLPPTILNVASVRRWFAWPGRPSQPRYD